MRFKLTLEYDGGPFLGWQRAAGGPSVQGALETAVFKLTGAHADVIGAGRTDAGVHARGQVAHIDIAKPLAPQRLADALNAHLRPLPVAVLHAEEAAPDFHARFDAARRVYLYRIINRRAPLALEAGKAWRVPRALDVEAMNAAARRLVGHHDFTTFRDSKCQAASPLKTLDKCEVSATPSPRGEGAGGGVRLGASESQHALQDTNAPRSAIQNDRLQEARTPTSEHSVSPHPLPPPLAGRGSADSGLYVNVICEARSFLHRQVRSIVGTLVEVGLGKMRADDVAAALAAKDRARCGPVAPPDGLYLMRVDY